MGHLIPFPNAPVSPTCDCGGAMRLFGIEPDPADAGSKLLTFVCGRCDRLRVDREPVSQSGHIMPRSRKRTLCESKRTPL
jgi:hypothetical protein